MEIPFHKTHTTEAEINAVIKTIRSGWLTMGPKTIEFEKKISDFLDCQFSISLNSATAALHLALKAIGLQQNDEVILPTNTFVATAEVVTYFNAKPVLCDVEYKTHNIDVTKIERLISDKTKAIIPVHFAGQPCDMQEIYQIAKKYKLKVIEDAAHALPSYYQGQLVGNLSQTDITCFSFYATKTLSTGEGGMATTQHARYAQSIKTNRLHGISRNVWDRYSGGSWYYEVIDNGNKYNTTDINAALGIEQLKKLEWMKEKREAVALQYNQAFANSNIVLPVIKEDRQSSWHLYVIKINNRDELYQRLKENGIATSVHFIPVHKHPYYKKNFFYKEENYPVANQVFEQSLSLPIYPDLEQEQIDYVVEKVLQFAC